MSRLTYADDRVIRLLDETRMARQNALTFMAELREIDSTEPRQAAYLLGRLSIIAGHCARTVSAATELLEEMRTVSLRERETPS